MLRTETGKNIWNKMEISSRSITISLNSKYDAIASKMSLFEGGETMTGTDYINRSQNKPEADFYETWNFNSATGEYNKTEAWDNTVIVLSEEALKNLALPLMGIFKISSYCHR